MAIHEDLTKVINMVADRAMIRTHTPSVNGFSIRESVSETVINKEVVIFIIIEPRKKCLLWLTLQVKLLGCQATR